MDDELNLLKVDTKKPELTSINTKEGKKPKNLILDETIKKANQMKENHKKLIQSMEDHPIIHSLLDMTLTLDQAKVVLTMLDSIKACSNNGNSINDPSLSM